jgi:hypothetical protein
MIDTAIVVGTYGTAPYVHLQLESWRRFAADCPLIVHDDSSPDRPRLENLCNRYGAEYYSTPQRLDRLSADGGHLVGYNGDHDCYPVGADFAARHGCRWLVKISRRYVLTLPWLEQLRTLIAGEPFPAWSGWDEGSGYGFVTFLIAMDVQRLALAIAELRDFVQAGRHAHPETFVHDCIERATAVKRPSYHGSRDCVGHWPLATIEREWWWPPDRVCHHDQFRSYAAVARAWGLDYTAEDFYVGPGW